ncbi:MAG TPA: chromate efflux transporter [Candidatus Acidoferrum sp.]|nr:chromate efflux transporter [Candidatus Acidoferrum sp.]
MTPSHADTVVGERPAAAPAGVAFRDALKVWMKVGLLSFGGPAGQIATMHRILVDEKRWIGEQRFLHALNYCMLLPGPEAQQLATYIGWLLHRTWGGIVAGTLFVLPGAVVMLGLSLLYAGYQEVPLVAGIFFGIKPAVLAIVLHALERIGKRALTSRFALVLAAAAFVAIFFLDLPFPLIVLGAGVIGYLADRFTGLSLTAKKASADGEAGPADTAIDAMFSAGRADHTQPSVRRAIRVLAVWLPLWLGPVAALLLWRGGGDVFSQIAVFFSKMAVVTFGGAYAVLAYVAQAAVTGLGWLRPGEMLDGLGMAETTPGPLILVLQYVGFLAGYRDPGLLPPWLAGTLAAALTLWVTFTPCFLWIFLGAPYVERLRADRRLNAALSAITAAVVGVILNLAVWFALHTIFAEVRETAAAGLRLWLPILHTIQWPSLALAAGAAIAMFRFKVGMLPTLAASALLGCGYYLLTA